MTITGRDTQATKAAIESIEQMCVRAEDYAKGLVAQATRLSEQQGALLDEADAARKTATAYREILVKLWDA